MSNKIARLIERTNNISRSAYIWYAASDILLAMQMPVTMAVATRTNGEADAGIFSLAIAEANLMYFLGQYGLRRYQSSDIHEDFKFSEYHAMRLITCTLMTLGCLAYCIFGVAFREYSSRKFLIIFLICLIKVIMAYEDVLHGHLQQKGRLDIAGKAATIRFATETLIYTTGLILTGNMLLTVAICLVVSFFLMKVTSYDATKDYCDSMRPAISKDKFRLLTIEGFPLFMGMFLNMYIGNAPKYAIDAYLNDEVQAVFNMVFMPTYVVQMVTQVLFNPTLTAYAELWQAHSREKFKGFLRMTGKMCLAIFGLAVLAMVIAATIGIPVLSMLFGTDLTDYKMELCVIMMAGGALGYSIYLNMVLAVIRAQRPLIYCYGIVAVLAKLLSGIFVKNYGVMGAAAVYAVLMILLTASLFIAAVIPLRKEWLALADESADGSHSQ